MNPPLRLLADDLTGALDSAAAFGAPNAPVPVFWRAGATLPAGALAFDTGTREASTGDAAETVGRIAPALFADRRDLCFKKIDSLLRGSEADEIDAVLRARAFQTCVIAPAFPAQRRATRGGRQGLLDASGTFAPLGSDLVARLEALGHRVTLASSAHELRDGITFFDAETDRDLDAIVAAGSTREDVLWVGSAGLAGALARRFAPGGMQDAPPLAAPLLGLFGTDHSVMLAQLRASAGDWLRLSSPKEVGRVARRLETLGAALVSADLPAGTQREAAAAAIETLFAGLVAELPAPATLVVAGGETLRGLCGALGAERLDVTGEIAAGIPRSTLVGGRWHGTVTISKSGAFGAPDLLSSLLAGLPAPLSGVRSA